MSALWVLEVGGEIRSGFTDLDQAGIAFDNAWRPDVSRSLTRVPLDPDSDPDDRPSLVARTYVVRISRNQVVSATLWSEGDPTASESWGDGDAVRIVHAHGVVQAIRDAEAHT